MECANCLRTIENPQMIYKYQDNVFCSPNCLAEFLRERVWDDVEEKWFDTEENMRICAMEEKSQW